jgi:hypothetical protein
VNVDNVKQEDWIVGGLALLLVIALIALPWFSIGGGSAGPITLPSVDLTAADAPDGWLGILGVIAALALIADLAVERLSPQTALPSIGGSRTSTRFVLAAAAAGFVALKFLFHIHFSIFGWGFYVCVIVAVALVFFAMQARSAAPAGAAVGGPPPPPPAAGTGGTPPSGSAPGAGGSTPPPPGP